MNEITHAKCWYIDFWYKSKGKVAFVKGNKHQISVQLDLSSIQNQIPFYAYRIR